MSNTKSLNDQAALLRSTINGYATRLRVLEQMAEDFKELMGEIPLHTKSKIRENKEAIRKLEIELTNLGT